VRQERQDEEDEKSLRAAFGRSEATVHRPLVVAAVALLTLVAIGAATSAAIVRWWPLVLSGRAQCALPGMRVEGRALAPGVAVRSQVEAMARALRARRLRLIDPAADAPRSVIVEATLDELGFAVDVEATAERALRPGRVGDPLMRARAAEQARRGGIDVPFAYAFDPRAVFALLAPHKEDLDRPPAPARLDLQHHAIADDRDGRALDLDAAAAAVERAAAAREPGPGDVVAVVLPFVAVRSGVTRDELARIDVSRVLASFDTYFSRRGDQAPRARNIEVAAARIDGLVVQPHEIESFNDVVGPRSEDNGFFKAFEIFKGEFVEGMGGGTCQVASTVHAVAFFGGLDVVERLPHSRPSAYIPVGLDATVVYPTVDLKIRNPFPFPVVFHATVAANALHVELLGADKPVVVELRKEVLSTTPFDRKIVEDRLFARPRRMQKGADGVEVRRVRVLASARPRGSIRVETSLDRYPPTFEIWKIPPGFDRDLLPPLGDDSPPLVAPLPAPASDAPAGLSAPAASPPRI
jgi:vancomycin resistance protein YoaR